jgi:hypothetical protein
MTDQPFAIISAHRGTAQSPEERAHNNAQMAKLKQLVFESGHSFIDTGGAWTEKGDDVPSYPVKEHSIFIPNISKEEALELGKMFEQDGVTVGKNGEYEIISSNGGEVFTGCEEPYIGMPYKGRIEDLITIHAVPESEKIWEEKRRQERGEESKTDRELNEVYTSIKGKRFVLTPSPVVASSGNWKSYFFFSYSKKPSWMTCNQTVIGGGGFPGKIPNIEDCDAYVAWHEADEKPIRTASEEKEG